ncbi:MAG: transfer protein Tra, partial [Actinobacteria bacterium HGW-Actinobacteria-5]
VADPITAGTEPAAILAWRIADQRTSRSHGPLPWLAGIPTELAQHPLWGNYLTARQNLIRDLADHIRNDHPTQPAWATSWASAPPASLVTEVEVWRAANNIPTTDLRPTGEPQHDAAGHRYQQRLDHQLHASQTAALDEWHDTLAAISPALLADDFAPTLARRLAQLTGSGINPRSLIDTAASQGPLPDDHAAAALWWRMARHLTPAVAEEADTAHHLSTEWLDQFTKTIGQQGAQKLTASPWWPALVTTIEHGLARGWHLDTLLDDARRTPTDEHVDTCQAWVWRLSLLTHPTADHDDPGLIEDEPPADLNDGYTPTTPVIAARLAQTPTQLDPPDAAVLDENDTDLDIDQALALEAIVRRGLPAPEPTPAEIRAMLDRRDMWRDAPPRERLVQINQLTADYFQYRYTDSWARSYVTERFGQDLTNTGLRPGYAPDGWTSLVTHLRRHNIADQEMLAAGVATRASTGRLIDRFRDRVTFPITNTDGNILGFVARRNPSYGDDDGHGPKYLNTAETALYHKGDELFIAGRLSPESTPVLTEGPFDAIAVTLAAGASHVGLAALGTSLTRRQAMTIHSVSQQPIVATDADGAGRVAAERDYWLLSTYGLDPRVALLPEGSDPADLLARNQAESLARTVQSAGVLGDHLIEERLGQVSSDSALEATEIVAAQPAERWNAGVEHIAERSGIPSSLLRAALVDMVRAWNADASNCAEHQFARTSARNRPSATQSRMGRDFDPSSDRRPVDSRRRNGHRAEHPSNIRR